MKTHARYLPIVLMLVSFSTTQAQFQIGLHGTYAVNSPKIEGTNIFRGAGVLARYFLTSKLAVGASLYAVLGKQPLAGIDFKVTQMPVTGMIEYFMTDKGVRPYVGLQAGSYKVTVKAEGTSQGSVSASETKLGIAPKLGLQIPVTRRFLLFGEGAYNIIFKESQVQVTQQQTTGKYISINAGILLSLGGR